MYSQNKLSNNNFPKKSNKKNKTKDKRKISREVKKSTKVKYLLKAHDYRQTERSTDRDI